MQHQEIQIKTSDGRCPTHVYHPDGAGPWPGVIVYMDAVGWRPAMMEIAERIANAGYFVLLPDLFYRVEFDVSKGLKLFSDPVVREDMMQRVMPSASPSNVLRDTQAFLDYLDAQPNVIHDKIGIVGYCMGGRLALYVAGNFGDRIAAAGLYHAGGVATEAPDSPHRLAPQIRAKLYIGGAMEDPGFDQAAQDRLQKALDDAGVDYTLEMYAARHGWVPTDTPMHDPVAAAKHWETLFELFDETLGTGSLTK